MNKHIDGMINALRTFVPKMSIEYKQESKIMRLLNLVVRLWCPDFMSNYTTTFGYTIYSNNKPESLGLASMPMIAHEAVHLYHRKQAPILYEIGYILPQALAIVAPFGLFGLMYSPLYWLFAFVIFALPIPAPARFYTEYHAYAMSMAVRYWMFGRMDMPNLKNFTSSSYYFMWPFESALRNMYAREMDSISSNAFLINRPLHQAVYNYLRDNNLLHKS